MNKPSLYSLALDNKSDLENKAIDAVSTVDTVLISKFINFLNAHLEYAVCAKPKFKVKGDVTIGIHSSNFVLTKILKTGKYQSAWEIYGTSAPKHFGFKKPLRLAFDKSLQNGEEFKYLALIAGTLGIRHWGDFTIAFFSGYFEEDKMVGLKNNSLEIDYRTKAPYYFKGKSPISIDYDKLIPDLAIKSCIPNLVLVKNEGVEWTDSEEDWKRWVLKDFPIPSKRGHKDYIEIISWQEIELIDNFVLRCNESLYQKIWEDIVKFQKDPNDSYMKSIIDDMEELQEIIGEYESKYDLKLELI